MEEDAHYLGGVIAGIVGFNWCAVFLWVLLKRHDHRAVGASNLAAASVAYGMLLLGVFVTAFYSFRMFFLVFHGKPRWPPVAMPTVVMMITATTVERHTNPPGW